MKQYKLLFISGVEVQRDSKFTEAVLVELFSIQGYDWYKVTKETVDDMVEFFYEGSKVAFTDNDSIED